MSERQRGAEGGARIGDMLPIDDNQGLPMLTLNRPKRDPDFTGTWAVPPSKE
ncbi:MAG: hypothetical protein WBV64_06965 [Mycobacterium sp.]